MEILNRATHKGIEYVEIFCGDLQPGHVIPEIVSCLGMHSSPVHTMPLESEGEGLIWETVTSVEHKTSPITGSNYVSVDMASGSGMGPLPDMKIWIKA